MTLTIGISHDKDNGGNMSGRSDVGSRINPRPPPRPPPPPLPRFAIPIHEYECKREKEGKLGKEIKDKRVGGSAHAAGMKTPILDDALIMQGSSTQWVNDTFFWGSGYIAPLESGLIFFSRLCQQLISCDSPEMRRTMKIRLYNTSVEISNCIVRSQSWKM